MMLQNCYCCRYFNSETAKCESDHEFCNFEYDESNDEFEDKRSLPEGEDM